MRARTVRPQSGSAKTLSPRVDPKFSINLPSVSVPNSIKDVQELHDHHKQFFGDDDPDLEEAASDERLKLIEQRKLSLQEAEQLLGVYRRKAHFFPFIVVPSSATVPSMARTSPFLLLCILTAAATADPLLRKQLDQEFRRILSSKVIVGGQKSLDYLQGLLVYVAWYPLHSKPKNSQAFMYVNLAIGLALDLGLDREEPNHSSFSVVNTDGLIENGAFTKAAKRAYLGTYYVSAALSLGFQKPNNMQYRDLMDELGQSILQTEPSSDLTALVSLERLAETIAVFHRSKDMDTKDPILADANAQMFQNELQAWKANTLADIRTLPHIALFERFVGIHIYSHELGFLLKPYKNYFKQVESRASQAHLIACLEACKKFFEYLLSIPEEYYADFTAFQWSLMVQAVLVLSRLTFVMASSFSWDPDTTRSNVSLVMYLDALCFRFHNTTSTPAVGHTPPKNPDILYVFKMILTSVKKSYERRVAKIEPNFVPIEQPNNIGIARGHCPILDPSLNVYFDSDIDMDSTYGGSWDLSGTPSTNLSGGPTNTPLPPSSYALPTAPLYHDLWATMTGSWAEEI